MSEHAALSIMLIAWTVWAAIDCACARADWRRFKRAYEALVKHRDSLRALDDTLASFVSELADATEQFSGEHPDSLELQDIARRLRAVADGRAKSRRAGGHDEITH